MLSNQELLTSCKDQSDRSVVPLGQLSILSVTFEKIVDRGSHIVKILCPCTLLVPGFSFLHINDSTAIEIALL